MDYPFRTKKYSSNRDQCLRRQGISLNLTAKLAEMDQKVTSQKLKRSKNYYKWLNRQENGTNCIIIELKWTKWGKRKKTWTGEFLCHYKHQTETKMYKITYENNCNFSKMIRNTYIKNEIKLTPYHFPSYFYFFLGGSVALKSFLQCARCVLPFFGQ